MRKCCHLTAISLLRKENYLNSQDLTIFSGNPSIHFLMAAAVYQVFFLHAPKETSSTGRSPELIQSFSQPWFALERLFFFSAWHSSFPRHNTNCQEGSCSEEICTYWDILCFIWCRLWSFWDNLPQSTNAAGKECSRLAWHFAVLLNI